MKRIIITTSFRFDFVDYPVSDNPIEVEDLVAEAALANGCAVDADAAAEDAEVPDDLKKAVKPQPKTK